MDSYRIKEIQKKTAYPYSVSVKQALLQVWNECEQDASKSKIIIGQTVYHTSLYYGKEPFKVVGIREKEVELEGDYSGGTHPIKGTGWMPIDGLLTSKAI